MKLYYAETKDGKAYFAFEGEKLICNNPSIFGYLMDEHNKASERLFNRKDFNISDYNIIEVEASTSNMN